MPMITFHPGERRTRIRDPLRHRRLRLSKGGGSAERKDHDLSLAFYRHGLAEVRAAEVRAAEVRAAEVRQWINVGRISVTACAC
jgi:hypothetical protein